MENLLKKNENLFRVLTQAKRPRLQSILKTLSRDEVDAICGAVLNAISPDGACPLQGAEAKRCSRHQRALRQLAFNKRLGWKKRRAIINQSGGAAWLVPILTTVVGSLVSKLLS